MSTHLYTSTHCCDLAVQKDPTHKILGDKLQKEKVNLFKLTEAEKYKITK